MSAAISNLTKYNERMRRGMLDKTFFLGEIDVNIYFDYGCADGSTLDFIAHLFPEHHFFGYDTDPKMVELARAKNIPNAMFSTDYLELLVAMKKIEGQSCLILNSLIHEVYSYLDDNGVDLFWDRVLNSGFNNISIRDMCVIPELANEFDDYNAGLIRAKADPHLLETFEDLYGTIENVKNQIHFLLKCRYGDNWDRELHENYLKCDYVELHNRIGVFHQGNYKFVMEKRFTLPFLKKFVKQEFDIQMTETTHIKIILGKRVGK